MALRKKDYADMEKYRKTRNAQRKRYYSKTQGIYPRHKWTDEDDQMVLKHNITDTELSAKLKCSVSAIQTRRWQLTKKSKEEQLA